MKKFVLEVLRRGMVACGFGPMILVVLYLILKRSIGLETLTVDEVCVGIVSLSMLAFVAGGMNAIYQIERLPLMLAILIHGGVLNEKFGATAPVSNAFNFSILWRILLAYGLSFPRPVNLS